MRMRRTRRKMVGGALINQPMLRPVSRWLLAPAASSRTRWASRQLLHVFSEAVTRRRVSRVTEAVGSRPLITTLSVV